MMILTIEKLYKCHSQSVCKVVHYGFQTGEGQNWYQSKWKLSNRKKSHTEYFTGLLSTHQTKDGLQICRGDVNLFCSHRNVRTLLNG